MLKNKIVSMRMLRRWYHETLMDFLINLRLILSLMIHSLRGSSAIIQALTITLAGNFVNFFMQSVSYASFYSSYTKHLITICHAKYTPITKQYLFFLHTDLIRAFFCNPSLTPSCVLVNSRLVHEIEIRFYGEVLVLYSHQRHVLSMFDAQIFHFQNSFLSNTL